MRLSRLRVPAGWLAGVLLLRPGAARRPRSLLAGAALAAAGEAVRLWASGHIEKTRRWPRAAPTRTRATRCTWAARCWRSGSRPRSASPWVLLAVAAYFVAFYPSVMREESRFLRDKFGAEYAAWARGGAGVPAAAVARRTARDPLRLGARAREPRVAHRRWPCRCLVALLYARGRWL